MVLWVRSFVGADAASYFPALARLRISVFREWPYLYDGSLEYEERYLQSYTGPDALLVLALEGDRVVGASTGLPLTAHPEVALPILQHAGLSLGEVFYFGESVLEQEYRGRGIGHRFFDEREQFARERGFRWAAFCAVVRPEQHPSRPTGYVPHDAFWTKRGFVSHPELVAHFSWKDVDSETETEKPMVFWLKQLGSSP